MSNRNLTACLAAAAVNGWKGEHMKRWNRSVALGSCVALACGAAPAGTGCANGEARDEVQEVAIELRFHQGTTAEPDPAQPSRLAPLSFVGAPGATSSEQVAQILVDMTNASTGQPYYLNFKLTKLATNVWLGAAPLLPRNTQIRFAARGLDPAGAVAFSGETLAIVAVDGQKVQIPLAPAQDDQTYDIPRLSRIVYPPEVYAGLEEALVFTIESTPGTTIGYKITRNGSTTPAAEFFPAQGALTVTNRVADLVSLYTPPSVTTAANIDYQVTITAASTQSAVAVTTNFRVSVNPSPPGGQIASNTETSVLFNPVIQSLTANGSSTPDTVELRAVVSDDGGPAQLTYQWDYTPNPGTPSAAFANGARYNPGYLMGYTVAHQGTIRLAVTDVYGGTTTLSYQLRPGQFANAVDQTAAMGIKQIVNGGYHTCALTGQGRVRCWGRGSDGALGYGNNRSLGDTAANLPYVAGNVPLPVDDPVRQLAAGAYHTCALLQSGLIYCWGNNVYGQLGYGRTDALGDNEPVTSFGHVTVGGLATRIAAGMYHTCAVLRSGDVQCWGYNAQGQLGLGNTQRVGDDEAVYTAGVVDLGAGVKVKDVALGSYHTCALLTTGGVRCWGDNAYGQLGYGHTSNLGDDEPVNNLPNVTISGSVRELVAGRAHTCVLTSAGALRCWGLNNNGQLGQSIGGESAWGDNPGESPAGLPGDIGLGGAAIDVAAGDYHTCAVLSDGQIKCWGYNGYGQLGYGDYTSRSTPPAAAVNLDGVSAYRIGAGAFAGHTCALRANGTVRCWGRNSAGGLGRGDTSNRPTATGDADVRLFDCGDHDCGQTIAVAKAGTGGGTVSSSPAGINCGPDCSEVVDYGATMTLRAAPAAGSSFTGWSGGRCSGTGTCVVTITDATLVTASFAQADVVFQSDPSTLAILELNGTVDDTSGNGRTPTLIGGTFVPTAWGQGLRLPAADPQGLNWSAYASLIQHPYTIEMVLTPDSVTGWAKLFGVDDASDAGWHYYGNSFYAWPVGGVSHPDITAGTRHYFAVVSTGPSTVDVYFQGVKIGAVGASFTAPPREAIFFRDDSSTSRYERLRGVIEAVRISRGSRTAAEIAAVQARLATRP